MISAHSSPLHGYSFASTSRWIAIISASWPRVGCVVGSRKAGLRKLGNVGRGSPPGLWAPLPPATEESTDSRFDLIDMWWGSVGTSYPARKSTSSSPHREFGALLTALQEISQAGAG